MDRQTYWPGWVHFLQRLGLRQIAAVVLESAGPLNWFAAQCVYLGQPFLPASPSGGNWQALAHLLENQAECRAFASFLRQEENQ
jgi:hypothetical protein